MKCHQGLGQAQTPNLKYHFEERSSLNVERSVVDTVDPETDQNRCCALSESDIMICPAEFELAETLFGKGMSLAIQQVQDLPRNLIPVSHGKCQKLKTEKKIKI